MQQNQVGARLIYENHLKDGYQAEKSTQSYLRLERALSTNSTTIAFPVLVNENQLGIFNTERRLNANDKFRISSINMLVAVPASAVDGKFKLYSFPSPEVFLTTTAADAMVLYNSNLSITIERKSYLPAWDTFRHLKIPTTQFTAAVNSPAASIDGAEDGWYPAEPNIILHGNRNNSIEIAMPAAIATVQANSRVILFIRGHLIQP